MSTAKTRIEIRLAEQFLDREFDSNASSLKKIKGGELSEAFLFEVGKSQYVLRVHSKSKDFLKDQYAYKHFRSEGIPIPEIVKYGRFDSGHFYAVSNKAPGVTQDELPLPKRKTAIPSVLETLDAIHGVDISNSKGYGYWRSSGQARRKSIQSFVSSSMWIPKKPWVDRTFHQKLWKEMRSLFQYLPKERYLVHGDYGHNNLLVDGKQVSGVIDWGNGGYGDFMHDIAWLDSWDPDINYGDICKRRYAKIGRKIPHYDERLRLHKLAITSGSFGFFAKSGQRGVYEQELPAFKENLGIQ